MFEVLTKAPDNGVPRVYVSIHKGAGGWNSSTRVWKAMVHLIDGATGFYDMCDTGFTNTSWGTGLRAAAVEEATQAAKNNDLPLWIPPPPVEKKNSPTPKKALVQICDPNPEVFEVSTAVTAIINLTRGVASMKILIDDTAVEYSMVPGTPFRELVRYRCGVGKTLISSNTNGRSESKIWVTATVLLDIMELAGVTNTPTQP